VKVQPFCGVRPHRGRRLEAGNLRAAQASMPNASGPPSSTRWRAGARAVEHPYAAVALASNEAPSGERDSGQDVFRARQGRRLEP
jgi:hypothetical protein